VPVAKFAEGKMTYPGPHQIHRYVDVETGCLRGDSLALASEPVPDGATALLQPRLASGVRVGERPTLEQSRAHALSERKRLPERLRGLQPLPKSEAYPVKPSAALSELLEDVRRLKVG
jgi:hypothetical protein